MASTSVNAYYRDQDLSYGTSTSSLGPRIQLGSNEHHKYLSLGVLRRFLAHGLGRILMTRSILL